MNLRLMAANFHDWLQRRNTIYYPDSALRVIMMALWLVVIGLLLIVQLCGADEPTKPANATLDGHEPIVIHGR